MAAHNDNMLNILTTPLIEILCKHPSNFKPRLTQHGTIKLGNKDTGIMANLQIKIGARVMLTFNVDTIDGLVNGSVGNVVGIEMGGKESVSVKYIIVQFDDEECGHKQRKKYPEMSFKYANKNGTPIVIQDNDIQLGNRKGYKHSAKMKIQQFPIRWHP